MARQPDAPCLPDHRPSPGSGGGQATGPEGAGADLDDYPGNCLPVADRVGSRLLPPWRCVPATTRPASRATSAGCCHHARRSGRSGIFLHFSYTDLGKFYRSLTETEGTAAKALRFPILTAARTGEAIGCRWTEYDAVGKVWSILAERMKSGRPHRVPLSEEAVAIVESMRGVDSVRVSWVASEASTGHMSLLLVLERLKMNGVTAYTDFRAIFGLGCRVLQLPREVAEMALAHIIEDGTEAAYRRGDLLEKRRRMMEAWANCATIRASGAVVQMKRSQAT